MLIITIIIFVILFIKIRNQGNKGQGEEAVNSDISNQCPIIKEVIGGLIGSITRHWNCCKPYIALGQIMHQLLMRQGNVMQIWQF